MMHNKPMRTVFFLTILLILIDLSHTSRADNHPQTSSAASKDLVITSDSGTYCQKLNDTLSEKIRLPHSIPVSVMDDALTLQKRGTALCHQRHVRAGIERLRRALLLLNKHEGPHQ